MGADFSGGGFEELARETERLKADAARLRTVTQQATQQTATDEQARRRLAERARAATSRSVAEAETIITRGAQAARVSGPEQTAAIAAQRRAMDSLATSSAQALRPIQQLRQWGPYAFSRSAQAAEGLASSLTRIGLTGAAAAPTGGPAGQPGTALPRLNERLGITAPAIGARPIPSPQAVTAYSASVTRAATAHAVLNAQMERHGALSSEFIQQVARGNVGLRELGSNLVVTAGKFGGWLAAGAGIFAVLGALGKIGTGAIDASSGVNQLQRVVNNVNADKLVGQIGGLSEEFNLPIEVVNDALYQMGKVFHDQESAVEASRAVLYAYKVGELDVATSSRYLTSIVNGFNLTADQQSVVFDQLNQAQNRYNISIANVMAGTAKAAGAFSLAGGDVTHLIALITTLSKATGQTGDVIGTAIQRSPHFIAMDQNRDVLAQYGIDPRGNIEEIYAQAIRAARDLGREKQRELAEALFGPQYGARVGVSLLRQGDLLRDVLADVRPEAAAGSAEAELKKTLGAAREQLARTGTELSALGANLARAGFFDALFLGVQALNLMLSAANDLLGVFNLIPKPFREVLTAVAEIYVLFRLMRRFNIGSTLPGRAGAALTNPRNAINDQRESLIVRRQELSDELVSASRQVTRAEIERSIAQEQIVAQARRQGIAVTEGNRVIQGTLREGQRSINLRDALVSYDDRINEARIRESAIAAQGQLAREQEAALRKQGPSPIGLPYPTRPAGGASGSNAAEITRTLTSTRAQLVRNMQSFGLIGGTLATGTQQVRAAASRVSARLRTVSVAATVSRVRGAAGSLAASARGMLAMVGPLDLAFAGVALFFAGLSEIRSRANEIADAAEQATTAATYAELQSATEQIVSSMENPPTFYIPGFYEGLMDQQEAALQDAERQQADVANFRSYIENVGARIKPTTEGQAAYQRGTYQDVYEAMASDIRKRLFQHKISQQDGERMLQALIRRARTDTHIEDPQALIETLRGQARGEQAQASAETIRQRAALAAARAPLYDAVGEARAALQTARRVRQALDKGGADQGEVRDAEVEVAEAERALQESLNDRAKAMLDARNALRVSQIDPSRGVARARQEAQNASRQLELLRRQDRPREEILQAIAAVNNAEFAVQQAIRERMLEMVDISARMREANAPLYAPLVSERTALDAARRRVEILRAHGGSGREIQDALASVAEAERALALAANERALSLLQAQGEVAVASIDPDNAVAQARQSLANARGAYELVQAQGRDQEEVLNAYAAVLSAENALQQAIEDRASAIAQARFDLQTARAEAAGNEVRAAAISVRSALYNLRNADTREETLSARAALVRARTGRREAIYQTEVEDIEFQADIGRLTLAEQISAYQRLLRTMNLTRDMRRDLRRRIYQLKQESESEGGFELDVGDIKLPTIYEIRRAVQAGGVGKSANVNVTQTNSYSINGVSDPQAVVDKISNHQADAARKNRNALRSAGVT